MKIGEKIVAQIAGIEVDAEITGKHSDGYRIVTSTGIKAVVSEDNIILGSKGSPSIRPFEFILIADLSQDNFIIPVGTTGKAFGFVDFQIQFDVESFNPVFQKMDRDTIDWSLFQVTTDCLGNCPTTDYTLMDVEEESSNMLYRLKV